MLPRSVAGEARRFFRVTPRECLTHARLVAAIGWIVVVVTIGAGSTNTSIFGPLKWTDFVHIYSLGAAARTHQPDLLYDSARLHDLQSSLVPESAADRFLTPYSPQTAIFFAPLTVLPYWWAGLVWAVISLAVYASILLAIARRQAADRTLLLTAALAFPPAWQLVLYGQTSALILLAFFFAWIALTHRRPFAAGVAWSLLWIKPQFGVALAAVFLLAGEWRIIAGAIVGSAVQWAVVFALWGPSIVRAYLEMLRQVPGVHSLLEPDAFKLHSIAAVTRLLAPLQWPLWAVLSLVVVWRATRTWTSARRLDQRFGVLALGALLVNPHLFIYDAVLLAPIALWLQPYPIAAWVYAVGLAFFFPTAVVIGVQASTLILCAFFWKVSRRGTHA